jgi:glycosyltransferase involved in cell wall biosynthesis
MSVIVAQKGAREHFLAARALHQQGLLAALVTDWYAFGKKSRKQKVESRNEFQCFSVSVFQRFGGPSARAARCEAIPDELVRAFPFRSLLWKWRVRRLAAQGRLYEAYVQTDGAFAAAVARLKLPPHEVFFGYSYASLEMLVAEKKRGVLTVLDQIDPGAVEFRLVAEEMRKHPEIAGLPPEFPAVYYERNRYEWEIADVIVVNSEWSREAIIAEGADPAKIEILPLAYEVNAENLKTETLKPERMSACQNVSVSAFPPLRMLWLGQVNVRKGIHYLMEAARLLERENIHFDVAGAIGILPGAVASAPGNMTFHGPISRDRAAEWYGQSDVFVLPTLSDGFAITQLEALVHGLPVITTPNCGRVVEDGITGFIVPPRDSQKLAEAILRFVRNRDLIRQMRPHCLEAVKAYSIKSYGERLKKLIETRGAKSIL